MNSCFECVIGLLAVAHPVSPGDPAKAARATTRAVPYEDLDLSTANGRATLNRRIERAANLVCRDSNVPSYSTPTVDVDCKTDALRTARAQAESVVEKQRLDRVADAAPTSRPNR
jgi:UrcA family protein